MTVPDEFHLYVDDSGSRDPDRKPGGGEGQVDWFGLGGFLIRATDKSAAEDAIAQFRSRWPQLGEHPLHSYDIRNKTHAFRWLLGSGQEPQRFYAELSELIQELPIIVHAAVVDRPGYNARYLQQYGPRRWRLCRTAFNILVERAAKFARLHNARLRVFVERSDKPTERQFKNYFEDMRNSGLPFDASRMQKYAPSSAAELRHTLCEFATRSKSSSLMQMADLVLWPVCVGGYRPLHRNYLQLVEWKKLLDAHCTVGNGLLGVKYSCFDTQTPHSASLTAQEPTPASAWGQKHKSPLSRALGGHQKSGVTS